jgi:protein O-mannosyl-transferase
MPHSTALAVFAWLLLVPVCLFAVRRHTGRLLVCAVLLYLVPHSVESSVFALELYFEHRNYFPGIGIFLFLAAGLGSLGARWPPLVAPMLVWCAVYVLLLALQAGSQVQIWSSAPLLRLNHVNQHPDSFRANEEMALHLAGVGALDSALAYSRRAGELSAQERPGDRQIRDIALHCLAGRAVPAALFDTLGTLNPQRPFAVVSTMKGFATMLRREECARADRIAFADRMAEIFLGDAAVATASPNYYLVLAGMENALQRFDKAYAYTSKFLEHSPRDVRGMLMQLHFTTALGKAQETQALKQQLLKLQQEGRLNLGDSKTLALYL